MIPETEPYNNYTGDGSTTQFDFDFYIESASQLVVTLTDASGTITTLTLNTDYTIHELGNENGSYITYPISGSTHTTLSSSEVISLQLSLPIEQQSEYGTSSELDLDSVEYSFDYITRIAQILNRKLERAVKVAEGSDIETDELAEDLIIVADHIDNVDTVSTNISKVGTVSTSITNVNTVAGSIANVNAVGTDIANVNAVKADLANIDAVNNNKTNIDTVANDLNSGVSAQHIKRVSENINDVTVVSASVANGDIEDVADNIFYVNAVGADIANVNSVAGDLTNIDAVNNNKTNIDAVAGISSNVTTVAGISSDVSTVAGISTDVTAVKNNAANITSVAGDLTNINSVAGDLTNIDNASAYAASSKQYAIGYPTEPSEGSAKYWAERASQNQLQADWEQTDTTKKDYIKNKPTQLSDFTDDTATNPVDKADTLTGLTATVTELNLLDGVTASTSELNILDGVTADANELNILDGITASTTELNYMGGVTSSVQSQLNDLYNDNDRLYEGVDLSVKFATEIAQYSTIYDWLNARKTAGNFSGIHVGDYINVPTSAGTCGGYSISAQTHKCRIIGINTYKGCGDSEIGNMIYFSSDNVIDTTIKWNPTDNNNGTSVNNEPYLASAAYAILNGINNYTTSAYGSAAHGANANGAGILQLLPSALQNVLKQKRNLLDTRYSSSGLLTYSTGWGWKDMGKLWLPNEIEVYGTQIRSNLGYAQGYWNPEANLSIQFPWFASNASHRIKRNSSNGRCGWWLSSAASHDSSDVCVVASGGDASDYTATLASVCLPLCFCI